jgi:hypothetical protein
MSRYFIDTEFIEGFHKPLFGKRRHFIDLISIGIVCEDGREYYAISKDFDLKSVWNKYDFKKVEVSGDGKNIYPEGYYMEKNYWLRDNVLKQIFEDWRNNYNGRIVRTGLPFPLEDRKMTFKKMKKVIFKYAGKSNKQIAEEIEWFIRRDHHVNCNTNELVDDKTHKPVEFYGYYADYDWMLFCSLFGRMIDLPKGFPMYCRDLKQMLDEYVQCEIKKCDSVKSEYYLSHYDGYHLTSEGIKHAIKNKVSFPKQTNEHNALADAKWNLELYNFLKGL